MGGETERQPIRHHKDLELYQRAREMRNRIHKMVLSFPDHERFDLTDQMRRASKSVPTNIDEGFAYRDTPAKMKQFLRISMGSANEMEAHLEAASDPGYIGDDEYDAAETEYEVIGRQLNRLITTWRQFEKDPASSVKHPASAASRQRGR